MGQVHLISTINKCVIKAKFEIHDNSVLKLLFMCTFAHFMIFQSIQKLKIKLVLITNEMVQLKKVKDGSMDDRCGLMILCASQ